MSNTRKFKAPFDMYKGDIKKGTISDHYNEEEDAYHFKTNYGFIYLPAPIVEQWEEVVDETPKITMEDIVVGKTVLKHNNTGGEYLVTGKTSVIIISVSEYTINEINTFFTIKQ